MARHHHPDDRDDVDDWSAGPAAVPRARQELCPFCAEPVLLGGLFCVKCENYVGPEEPAPNMKPVWNWLYAMLAVGAAAWWAVLG